MEKGKLIALKISTIICKLLLSNHVNLSQFADIGIILYIVHLLYVEHCIVIDWIEIDLN